MGRTTGKELYESGKRVYFKLVKSLFFFLCYPGFQKPAYEIGRGTQKTITIEYLKKTHTE